MRLYFMRHGHAEHGRPIPDEQRELTPKGVQRIETTAKVLALLEIEPDVIYSSPRVRARQTAEMVAAALRMEITIDEAVNFSFSVEAVRDFIAENGDADLMFVGHEPTMSETIEAITGGMVKMKPGSLARVDMVDLDRLHGELVWLIAPKVFMALDAD